MANEDANCDLDNRAESGGSAEQKDAQLILSELYKYFEEENQKSEKEQNYKLILENTRLQLKLLSLQSEIGKLNGEADERVQRRLKDENGIKEDKQKLEHKLNKVEADAVNVKKVLSEQIIEGEKKLQDAHAENLKLQEKYKLLEEDASEKNSEIGVLKNWIAAKDKKIEKLEVESKNLKGQNDNFQAHLRADKEFQKGLAAEAMKMFPRGPMLENLVARYAHNHTQQQTQAAVTIANEAVPFGHFVAAPSHMSVDQVQRYIQANPYPFMVQQPTCGNAIPSNGTRIVYHVNPSQAPSGNKKEASTVKLESKETKDAAKDTSQTPSSASSGSRGVLPSNNGRSSNGVNLITTAERSPRNGENMRGAALQPTPITYSQNPPIN